MVNSVDSIYMFGKEADTMRMLRSEDQNRGFDEKLAVLWCFFTAVHFIQVVVQKHTRNCQLDEQSQHVWQGCRYHADVQSKAADRQDSDQLWYGGKNEASVSRRLHPPWVEYRILTTVVKKHYRSTKIINNVSIFHIDRGTHSNNIATEPHHEPGLTHITISSQ